MTETTPSTATPGTPNIAGLTPPSYLNTNESVLFETRPHFIAAVGLGRTIWFVAGTLLFLPFVIAAGQYFWIVALLWLPLVALPVAKRYMRWRKQFMTLTDQRMIMGRGTMSRSFSAVQLARIGGHLDASTYRITSVRFGQGAVGRMFNFGDIIFGTNRHDINWPGVKDPTNVRRTIEELVGTMQEGTSDQAAYREAMIRKVAEVETEEKLGFIRPRADVRLPRVVRGKSPASAELEGGFCPSCGTPNALSSSFCVKCGKELHLAAGSLA